VTFVRGMVAKGGRENVGKGNSFVKGVFPVRHVPVVKADRK